MIILAVPKGIEVSPVGLDIQCALSFEDWLHLGEMLKVAEGSMQFWLGDYLNYGEKNYGEKYAQAVDARQAETWKHYAWVAASVQKCTRVHDLSWAHHREVAKLDTKKQVEWLERAEKKGWSSRELKAAIRSGKSDPELDGFQCSLCGRTFPEMPKCQPEIIKR